METAPGHRVAYDALVLALGARRREALRGALTFDGDAGIEGFRAILSELEAGAARSLAFVVPEGVTWPLPLYELALMTAERLRGRDVRLTFVTPERDPLHVFGVAARERVRTLLAERGIALRLGARPLEIANGILLTSGGAVTADRIVALPALEGPRVAGLPCDRDGFVDVDEHGAVRGAPGVWAAGDGTTQPVKQGGLAAQQADAAAEAIASAYGAPCAPSAFRPHLRAQLLTGTLPWWFRGGRDESLAPQASSSPLWRPAGKVAARYLTPYLAGLLPLGASDTLREVAPPDGGHDRGAAGRARHGAGARRRRGGVGRAPAGGPLARRRRGARRHAAARSTSRSGGAGPRRPTPTRRWSASRAARGRGRERRRRGRRVRRGRGGARAARDGGRARRDHARLGVRTRSSTGRTPCASRSASARRSASRSPRCAPTTTSRCASTRSSRSTSRASEVALRDGGRLGYDVLLAAPGGRPEPAVAGRDHVRRPRRGATRCGRSSTAPSRASVDRIAFVVPDGVAWPLPAYELALLAYAHLHDRGAATRLDVVTPEDEPLGLFGPPASARVRAALAARGIGLHPLDALARLGADAVVALPRITGPRLAGLPSTPDGFLPVDDFGRVEGAPSVYAAGDATDHPVKQGGLAAQQAEAAAAHIAALAGAPVTPRPYAPRSARCCSPAAYRSTSWAATGPTRRRARCGPTSAR